MVFELDYPDYRIGLPDALLACLNLYDLPEISEIRQDQSV